MLVGYVRVPTARHQYPANTCNSYREPDRPGSINRRWISPPRLWRGAHSGCVPSGVRIRDCPFDHCSVCAVVRVVDLVRSSRKHPSDSGPRCGARKSQRELLVPRQGSNVGGRICWRCNCWPDKCARNARHCSNRSVGVLVGSLWLLPANLLQMKTTPSDPLEEIPS